MSFTKDFVAHKTSGFFGSIFSPTLRASASKDQKIWSHTNKRENKNDYFADQQFTDQN